MFLNVMRPVTTKAAVMACTEANMRVTFVGRVQASINADIRVGNAVLKPSCSAKPILQGWPKAYRIKDPPHP